MNATSPPVEAVDEEAFREIVADFSAPLLDAIDEVYPERDYPSHAERTERLLFDILEGAQLSLPARIHDPFAKAASAPETPEAIFTREYIADGLAGRSRLSPDVVRHAVAIESCAYGIEQKAESWRAASVAGLDRVIDGTDSYGGAYTFEQELARHYGIGEQSTLINTAKTVRQAIINPETPITPELRKYRAGLNLDDVVEALDKYDIDAFYRYTAEIIDNIRHPNPYKPASMWQDAQAVLSFVAPALELIGDTRTAVWARDEALIAIYKDTPGIFERALAYNEQALNCSKAGLNDTILEAADEIMLRSGVDYEITQRIKGIGSTAEKIDLRPDGLHIDGQPNDMIGYKVVIDDKPDTDGHVTESQWRLIAEHLVEKLKDQGLQQISDIDIYLDSETKASNYKSVHCNFVVMHKKKPVTVEVQIVTKTADEYNNLEASPVLQKARFGFSRLSTVLRKRDKAVQARRERIAAGNHDTKTQVENDYTDEDKASLAELRSKIRDFRTRASNMKKILIKPRSLARVAAIEEFAEADKMVLGPISQMDVLSKSLKELEVTLPATEISEDQFEAIVNQLIPGMMEDYRFREAYDIARSLHTTHGRKHADGNYFENHILPVALGLIYRISKDVSFDSRMDALPVFAAALLHDFKEDAYKKLHEKNPVLLQDLLDRYEILITDTDIDETDELVKILTKPTVEEIEASLTSSTIPITIHTDNADGILMKSLVAKGAVDKLVLSGNTKAMLVKFYDRAHNIRCDIHRLEEMIINGHAITDSDLEDIIEYREKSRLFFEAMDLSYVKSEATWIVQEIDSKLELALQIQRMQAENN